MKNVYQIVLDQILQKLKDGVVPWRCPWINGVPKNYVTGKDYSGLNIILLGMLMYERPWYLTFNQLRKLNAYPKPGEKANIVIFYKPEDYWDEEQDKKTGELKQVQRTKYILRYYRVFNVQQTTLRFDETPTFKDITACERVIENIPKRPLIVHERNMAFYSPRQDIVNVPKKGG